MNKNKTSKVKGLPGVAVKRLVRRLVFILFGDNPIKLKNENASTCDSSKKPKNEVWRWWLVIFAPGTRVS